MPVCPICRSEARRLGSVCESCGDAVAIRKEALAEDDPLLGRMVGGRFALVDVVGAGAVGVVYEAIQHPVGRRCALKVLRDDLVSEASMQARFLREATAASRLNHPNVVALYDFGVDPDGLSFIAMEYVEGHTLTEFIDSLDIDAIVHVLRQILRALAEAHEQGIVHRDLKPENVILCNIGSDSRFVKVLDFGLAKLEHHHEDGTISQVGEVFGTPLYMSPEQVVGSDHITPAADIYAFGAMAFELLTGEPPFHGRNAMVIMQKHLNTPVPKIQSRYRLGGAAPILEMIHRCLAKKPESRYGDARNLLSALDEALGFASGPTVRAPTLGERDDHDPDSDSDLAIALHSEPDLNSDVLPATWLHAPPAGSPRWEIPGKSDSPDPDAKPKRPSKKTS